MLAGLVVADDLTGACDTGHEFAARGYRTRVSLDATDESADADVLVVDTDSRYAPAEAAADAVREATEAHPAETLYKKVDSTLRGNVASEVEAALRAHVEGMPAGTATDSTQRGVAVVAPAAPATGRTTACGVHLVDGRPVTDTEPGRESRNGPASSRLVDCFADGTLPVGHLGIETVATGPDAVADALRTRGGERRILTADAVHGAHLRAVARGADRIDEPTIYAGSAGLAGHVPVAAPTETAGTPVSPSPAGDRSGVLGVAGSVAPQTLAAIDALPEEVLVGLDAESAVADPEGTAGETATRVRDVLAAENRVLLTAAADDAAVERTLRAGRHAGLTERETRERVAGTLAETVGAVVDAVRPAGLFLTGGDTAVAVLDAVGADAVLLSGEAVDAGIPLGTVEGGRADGTTLVTKAGAFGGRETVVNCLDRLREI